MRTNIEGGLRQMRYTDELVGEKDTYAGLLRVCLGGGKLVTRGSQLKASSACRKGAAFHLRMTGLL
jgi:hypothetical protein